MKIKQTTQIKVYIGFFLALITFAGCNKDAVVEPEVSSEIEMELKESKAAQNQILADIKRATAKYHDLGAATEDGYVLDPHCVEHPQYGGMGHHAVNMARIVPAVVPSEPGVLVYEPTKNGKYRLVAAEYIVPAVPWDAMHAGERPMLGEVEFADHREINYVENEFGDIVPVNANGGPPFPHYQLHVWVWKNNPNGMYFPFNPNVSCEFAID